MSESSITQAAKTKAFIERILRLKEEQDALTGDIREVYAEAKANGYDKTALGLTVAGLRKQARDPDRYAELTDLARIYLDEYEGRVAPASARVENIEEIGAPNWSAAASPIEPQASPAAAAETAGDDLREPLAAAAGQIVREGDAPRETGRQDADDDRRTGGDASCPDAQFNGESREGHHPPEAPPQDGSARRAAPAGTAAIDLTLPTFLTIGHPDNAWREGHTA